MSTRRNGTAQLCLLPVTFRQACAWVQAHHRHSKPPRGHKFSIGVAVDGALVGVAMSGRPVARALDDGKTIEVLRVCTDGTRNACSILYGASRRAAIAMGYVRGVTYTQEDEPGSSLLASGWTLDAILPARGSWAESTADARLASMRDAVGSGGVARKRWVWSVRHA